MRFTIAFMAVFLLMTTACVSQNDDLIHIENTAKPAPDGSIIAAPSADVTIAPSVTPEPAASAIPGEKEQVDIRILNEGMYRKFCDFMNRIQDDGWSGVGTVRGNTNGNLVVGGRAAQTGDSIYYLSMTESNRIYCYSLTTGNDRVVCECFDVDANKPQLNIIGTDLFFLGKKGIYRVDLNSGKAELFYLSEQEVSFGELLLIGDYVLFAPEDTTYCIDADSGTVICTVALCIKGTIDGRFYGITRKDGVASFVGVSTAGEVFLHFGEYMTMPIAFDGNLYTIAYSAETEESFGTSDWLEPIHCLTLSIVSVSTGERTNIELPGHLPCVDMNISPQGLFIQNYEGEGWGTIWHLNFDMSETAIPETIAATMFESCISLGECGFLQVYVACDAAD